MQQLKCLENVEMKNGRITFHKASGRYMVKYTKPNGMRGTVYGKIRAEARGKLKIKGVWIPLKILENKENSYHIKKLRAVFY